MASDVTARGVDFDDVTLVVQMGVPSNREQYIHRLGRTGRAGKSGEGVLVLSREESFFAEKDIADLPLSAIKDRASPEDARAVAAAMARVSDKTKAQTYSAWLGFYKPFCRKMGLSPAELVRMANFLATDVLGCDEVPGLMKKTVGMMGLKGVPGLNIVAALPDYDGKARGGGGRPASRPKDRDPRSAEPRAAAAPAAADGERRVRFSRTRTRVPRRVFAWCGVPRDASRRAAPARVSRRRFSSEGGAGGGGRRVGRRRAAAAARGSEAGGGEAEARVPVARSARGTSRALSMGDTSQRGCQRRGFFHFFHLFQAAALASGGENLRPQSQSVCPPRWSRSFHASNPPGRRYSHPRRGARQQTNSNEMGRRGGGGGGRRPGTRATRVPREDPRR